MSISKQSLFRRDSGIWYVLITEDNGKTRWKSTRCKLKSEALKFLSKERATERSQPKKRLGFFVNDFLAYAESIYAQNNVELYERYLRRFKEFVGDVFLESITVVDFDKFKAKRLREAKPSTVNIEMRTLKSAFAYAVKWNLIPRNPCEQVKLPQAPEEVPLYIIKEDFTKLLDSIPKCEDWYRDVILFAALTGMRRAEICNLKWSNVDMVRRVLNIQSDQTFHVKSGKRRTIPIGEAAFVILANRFSLTPEGYVFTYNGSQVKTLTLTHKFKISVRRAGLDDRLHFHNLRHSCASWLASDGVSIFQIAKLLGHSTVGTTEKFYAHIQPDKLRGVVDRLKIA